ncbi:type II secretion system F family protein, partial [Candidatus Peregrinibacteria bacterium]|nr:type II secretion system F family protein [Candidatus Peregrinibacteria bacterium]
MPQFNSKLLATHLEIGLSKEDEAKMNAMRTGKALKGKLSLRGLIKKANQALGNMTKITLQEKVTFFQLLAVMINAGVPLIRSLNVLSRQNRNPRFRKLIADLASEMEQGKPLSESMKRFDWLFTESDRGMIASGEASGNLNSILNDIARQTEKNAMILSQVKGAMIYPIAIILIMIAALALMLTMVVPKITELFTQGGQELPLTTQILISSSDFTQANWDLMSIIAIVCIVGIYLFRKSKRGHYLTDYAFIKVPIFGKIVRQVLIARFARMLASLMMAGIPIVKALDINANAVGNAVY